MQFFPHGSLFVSGVQNVVNGASGAWCDIWENQPQCHAIMEVASIPSPPSTMRLLAHLPIDQKVKINWWDDKFKFCS